MKSILAFFAAGAAGLVMTLSAGEAEAATYDVCLRIPVTISDGTGQANDIGATGPWVARGIRIASVKAPNGIEVAGFPKFAGASDGCFTFTSSQSGDFEIGIQPWGMLAAGNELKVLSPDQAMVTYSAVASLPGDGLPLIWPTEYALPRMYTIFAYAIQSGFRGNFNNELLTVHYDATSPCNAACNSACTTGGFSHISVCPWATQRKFLMAHEYGHSNLSRSISFPATNDLGYLNASGHGMTTKEWSSGAAMEGWAHFVAVETWNGPTGGSEPLAWMRYWNATSALVDVEGSQGGCSTGSSDNANFRGQYADNCFQTDPNCAGGNCVGVGAELDWMRMWWDFYSDPDMPGTPPSASDLHTMIDAAGPWGSTNVWQTLLASLSGDQRARFIEASVWNGVSE